MPRGAQKISKERAQPHVRERHPLLAQARITVKEMASFIRAAVRRNDAAALVAAKDKLRRVKGDGLALILFELARAAKAVDKHIDVGLALQELAMAVKHAPIESFNNALYYLTCIQHTKRFDPALAQRWLHHIVPFGPRDPAIFHNAAALYVRLGDRDRALQMVAGAVLYEFDQLKRLTADPDLAPLHADPRYQRLFAKGTPEAEIRAIFDGAERPRPQEAVRNSALEAAIAADPTAVEPYLVYGDWLQERGDPRGELIAIQHARLKSPRSRALREREAAFLAAHAEALRGTVATTRTFDGDEAMALEWHLGFVRRARFKYVSYDARDNHVPDIDVLVRDFFRCPSSQFVQELSIGVTEPDESHEAVVAALIEARPVTLRWLHLAERTPEECELSWVDLGDLGGLWRALPGLERVIIEGGQFSLGDIETSSVREIEIRTSGLRRRDVQALTSARWPQLERLQIWFGSAEYGSEATVDDLAGILSGAGLPKLQYLGLMNAEFTNALAAELPSAKILPQLTTLDLSMGTLTPDGLAPLLASAPAFAHLDVLDLSANHLTGTLDRRVKRLARRVVLDTQREQFDFEEGDDRRYVAIGE